MSLRTEIFMAFESLMPRFDHFLASDNGEIFD